MLRVDDAEMSDDNDALVLEMAREQDGKSRLDVLSRGGVDKCGKRRC
jgi:hypothetical protein